jgi:very-short-patch-repair endonuclease
MQADARRENILQAHGYNIIRFTHPNVRLHTSDVCQRLLQHIQTIERNTQND